MRLSIALGKTVFMIARIGNRAGSTWPGHIALNLDSKFVRNILKKNPHLSIILVAGTNGKTTTTKFIEEVLEKSGKKVFRNAAGANLLNGIATALLKRSSLSGKIPYDVAIFEVDENTLPPVLSELSDVSCQMSIVLLNLFRDQLDRYGEVNTIAKNWLSSLKNLADSRKIQGSSLIVNGDDPMLRFIGENSHLAAYYFGLDEKHMQKKEISSDVDFLYCPYCGTKLTYQKRSYSHLGIFKCPHCSFSHKKTISYPEFPNPMLGLYNRYNINAAALLLQKEFSVSLPTIKTALVNFSPAFGRQEKITYQGKDIFLLLSKNPTGFNQSLEAILEEEKNPHILLLLNDRIPDGRDVSWIWDVDFEMLAEKRGTVSVSGDRVYDMALRIRYAGINLQPMQINADLEKAIGNSLQHLKDNETLYILATYSAMLDARKILKGHAIL
ncbi:MAG: MurT ligase domain-containing protein [Candidatus Levyibacteriota bacterium]